MSVTKIIEVVGRSSESSDAAVKNALAEAGRNIRDIKALDVVSVGLRGDNMDEWGALVRISFLVENVDGSAAEPADATGGCWSALL